MKLERTPPIVAKTNLNYIVVDEVDEVEREHHHMIRANAGLSKYKYNEVVNVDTFTNNSIDYTNDDNDDMIKVITIENLVHW